MRKQKIFVDYGTLSVRDPNYGMRIGCYACGTSHLALGVARIRDGKKVAHVPLCRSCLAISADVVAKYLNVPDLIMTDGGPVTAEQIAALAEGQGETEQ